MFIKFIHGKESVTAKAAVFGLEPGEALKNGLGYGRPSIGGNTFAHKDALKQAGARWNGDDKVWSFESWAQLESALEKIERASEVIA